MHPGFYGGVNYGFGYSGVGFVGGEWRGGRFAYNTAVVNVNRTVIHNTYINKTVMKFATTVRPTAAGSRRKSGRRSVISRTMRAGRFTTTSTTPGQIARCSSTTPPRNRSMRKTSIHVVKCWSVPTKKRFFFVTQRSSNG